VDRQLVSATGKEPSLAEPKTAASVRTIPLPDVVIDALAAHIADYGTGPDGLLFSDESGLRLGRNRFSERIWRPAIKASSAPTGTGSTI
jgi:hypothetical protein